MTGKLAVCVALLVVLAACGGGVQKDELDAELEDYYARLLEKVDERIEDYYARVDKRMDASDERTDEVLATSYEATDAVVKDYFAQVNRAMEKNDAEIEELLVDFRDARDAALEDYYDYVVDLVNEYALTTEMEDALCLSDYWLVTLCSAFLALIDHLQGVGTLEDLLLYGRYGIELTDDYGREAAEAAVCVLEGGRWRVKQDNAPPGR